MAGETAVPTSAGDITAAWVSSTLGADERFDGARWAEIQPERIGEGFGLDGLLFRVHLPGSVTPSVIVKLAGWTAGFNEPSFYQHVAPHMPGRLVACYHAETHSDGRCVLVLEDLAEAAQGDALVGESPARTEALIAAVANYQARFWGGTDPAISGRKPFTFSPDRHIDDFDAHRERFVERFASETGPDPRAILDEVRTRRANASSLLSAAQPTLVHTDLHLDNVMFIENEPVILDWPGASLGPGVIDLARVLIEGMTLQQRRDRHAGLVGLYQDVLASAGVGFSSAGEFDDLIEAACVWMCWTTFEWAGSEDPGLGRPRVLEILQSVVRNSFGAAQEGWLRTS